MISILLKFYRSTLGKKVLMALTGLVMWGFVIGHMAGNLKVFAGWDSQSGMYKIDHYAVFLREMGADIAGEMTVLWMVRIVLLASVFTHVLLAIQLRRLNMAARPERYQMVAYRASNVASRTMFWGGLILAAFIVFHILHFTTGDVHFDGFVHGNVYANVHAAFQHWYLVAFYVLAMAALGCHLYHGGWSLFQTLGLDSPSWNGVVRGVVRTVAVVLFAGFVSVPLAIFAGLVPAPRHQALGTGHAQAAPSLIPGGKMSRSSEPFSMSGPVVVAERQRMHEERQP